MAKKEKGIIRQNKNKLSIIRQNKNKLGIIRQNKNKVVNHQLFYCYHFVHDPLKHYNGFCRTGDLIVIRGNRDCCGHLQEGHRYDERRLEPAATGKRLGDLNGCCWAFDHPLQYNCHLHGCFLHDSLVQYN